MKNSEKPWFSNRVFLHTANKIFKDTALVSAYKILLKKIIKKNYTDLNKNVFDSVLNFKVRLAEIRDKISDEIKKSDFFESSTRSANYATYLINNLSILIFLEYTLPLYHNIKLSIIHIIKKYMLLYSRRAIAKYDPIYYIGNLEKEKSFQEFYLALKWFYSEETKRYYTPELLKQMKDYEENVLSKEPDKDWRAKYYFPRLR